MLFTVFRGLRQARNAILAMSQSLGFYVVWGSKSGPGAEKIASEDRFNTDGQTCPQHSSQDGSTWGKETGWRLGRWQN